MKKNNSKVFLISFIVMAVAAVGASVAVFLNSDFLLVDNSNAPVKNNNVQNDISETPGFSATSPVPVQTEPVRTSPMIDITSEIGVELTDIDESHRYMDRISDNNKEFDIDLFSDRHETIHSFTFDISSEDNSSYISDFKSGFGISVTAACKNPSVMNDNWFKSTDRTFEALGSHASITWTLPEDVGGYIDGSGHFMIGHWWSDVISVRIDRIICLKTFTDRIKSDGVNSKDYSEVLNSNNKNELDFAVSEGFLKEDQIMNALSFHVSGDESLGLMEFEIIVKDRNGTEYPYRNLVQYSDDEEADIIWVIPDLVSEKIDDHCIITFRYNSGNNDEITIGTVNANYYLDL